MIPQREHRGKKTARLWGIPFIFLNISFLGVFTNIALFYLYPLALNAMGGQTDVIGFVMGLFSIATVTSRPLCGKLVSSKGEFRVISAGIAVSLVASSAYFFITEIGPCMFLVRVVHGIGFSAFISGSFSLAAKAFDPGKRGEAFSIIGASLMAAVALAPPFGESLIHKWGFHALYIAAAISLVLGWIAALVAIYPISPPPPKSGQTHVRYLSLLKNRSFIFLLFSTLIFAHCQSTVGNFLALIAAEKGVSSGRFFFATYSVAILILLTMGRIIDGYGKLFFLKLSYPILILGILFIPVAIDSAFFPVAVILYGTGIGLLFPVHNALAADHGRKTEKPGIMSLFTATYDTGFITGAIVSGWFAYQTTLDMLFFATGLFGLLGLLIALLAPWGTSVKY